MKNKINIKSLILIIVAITGWVTVICCSFYYHHKLATSKNNKSIIYTDSSIRDLLKQTRHGLCAGNIATVLQFLQKQNLSQESLIKVNKMLELNCSRIEELTDLEQQDLINDCNNNQKFIK